MAYFEREIKTDEIGGVNFNARLALEVIDEIITDIYLPFRGAEGYDTERAVLVAAPHVPHRENDAEHSWNVDITGQVLYDVRHDIGLEFPENFDINKASVLCAGHDLIEIESGDVEAMTPDPSVIALKSLRERIAARNLSEKHPNLRGVMQRWQEYERKDTPEAQYISDVDKILACRMIFIDGGKKWHEWNGYQTGREDMVTRIRAKLLTDMGHKLFDELEKDIDANPEVFPYSDMRERVHQLVIDIPGLAEAEL